MYSSTSFLCVQKAFCLALLLLVVLLAEPTLAGGGQRMRGMRLTAGAEQPLENQFGPSQRMFYAPNKLMANQRMAGYGNDWASDPVEQFLNLKRASLLARLASQSARGFGRK